VPASPRSLTRAERTVSRARAAHQRGLHAGATGQPAMGVRQLRAGLLLLGWEDEKSQVRAADHPLASRLLISLAHLEAEQGRTEYGLSLLDLAEDMTADGDRGILLSQRALLMMRTWQASEALRFFDEAMPLLEGYPDTAVLTRALLNRGFLHLNVGSVRKAHADFARCQRIAAAGPYDVLAAKAAHNLGCCDLLAADIPAALRRFAAAEDGFRRSAPQWLPVLATDKARALLAVGLTADAMTELGDAVAAFRRQRLDQDLAQAELALAQAALAAGALAAARRWAAAARRRFRRQGNDACAYLADLTQLRSRFAASPARGPHLATIADEAASLAARLRGCGLGNDADLAELLAARALIACRRAAAARQRIAAVRRAGMSTSLEVSLLRRLVRAELAELEGRPTAMLAELRAGLDLVRVRRNRLGSIDLQTATGALGADLAAAGLRQALNRGSAPAVFAWLERARAQAFRATPVRPPADARVAEILAELRQLSYLIRGAELNGHRDPAALAKRARMQHEIRERSWQAAGSAGSGDPAGSADVASKVTLGEVAAALRARELTLVSIFARDEVLHAVVVNGSGARLIRLGDAGAAAEAALRLAADLDALAGRRMPTRLETVIRESISRETDVLTAEIVVQLRALLSDEGVVIVPTVGLAGIPWHMLPDFRGRPVMVCPSASAWMAACLHSSATAVTSAAPPLLVEGPDLDHAAEEVTMIAEIYPGARLLLAESATVSATLRALDGAPLAHLAAHGHDDQENFLFSRLDLADGPLMAYDIQQLNAAPRQVILSACDVGRSVVRPGGEFLGFTAALLYVGTATVISSVARVTDEAAAGVMTAYHRALAAGTRPARALAEAVSAEPLSPFLCFGSG
jgi:CHAT domain